VSWGFYVPDQLYFRPMQTPTPGKFRIQAKTGNNALARAVLVDDDGGELWSTTLHAGAEVFSNPVGGTFSHRNRRTDGCRYLFRAVTASHVEKGRRKEQAQAFEQFIGTFNTWKGQFDEAGKASLRDPSGYYDDDAEWTVVAELPGRLLVGGIDSDLKNSPEAVVLDHDIIFRIEHIEDESFDGLARAYAKRTEGGVVLWEKRIFRGDVVKFNPGGFVFSHGPLCDPQEWEYAFRLGVHPDFKATVESWKAAFCRPRGAGPAIMEPAVAAAAPAPFVIRTSTGDGNEAVAAKPSQFVFGTATVAAAVAPAVEAVAHPPQFVFGTATVAAAAAPAVEAEAEPPFVFGTSDAALPATQFTFGTSDAAPAAAEFEFGESTGAARL